MLISVFEGEKKISAIVRKVFGGLDEVDAKRAEEALVRANPQLKTIDRVEKGTLLVVPTIPGIRPPPVPGRPPERPLGPEALLAEVRQAVRRFRTEVEKSTEVQIKQAEETLTLLKGARPPELKEDVARVMKATEERLRETKARATRTDEVLKQVETDLETLAERLL